MTGKQKGRAEFRVPFISACAKQTYRMSDWERDVPKTYETFDLGDVLAMNASDVRNMTMGYGFCFVADAYRRPVFAVLYETNSDAEEARELIAKALEKAVAIIPQD